MVEFEEELRRQGSFRGPFCGNGPPVVAPPSPTPSNESNEAVAVQGKETAFRNRAATYAFKIRNRVGSSVSQLSRVVLPDKKDARKSPAAKRKLSASRQVFSSPQLPKKPISEDAASRNSSCSTSSDLSTEKAKWRESLKEEPEDEEETSVKPDARSANTSPINPKKLSHKRTRSSDEVIDLKSSDIDLKDIIVSEKTGSPEPSVSPIDWEAVGNIRTPEKVREGGWRMRGS